MNISPNSFIWVITSTLAVIAMDLPVLAQIHSSPGAPVQPLVAPSLAGYRVDIQQTSVSGVSSGGAMAVQMHVAHSSIMRGVGVVAGVAYDCADSSRILVSERLIRGLGCIDGELFGGSVDSAFAIGRTTVAAAVPGAIDDPAAFLPRQKAWLFSGYNDGSVRRKAMNAVAEYYDHYINPGNVNSGNAFYKNNNHAPHALITDNYGGPCLDFNHDYINNCTYDMAGRLLEHIYGRLNPRNSGGLSASIVAFDQREFVASKDPKAVGLADIGYVYAPMACLTQTCRVHVVFHGCKQYAGTVGGAVYRHGGYNEWADTNNLVVLYPQTVATELPDMRNPKGCWDWWGHTDPLPLSRDFARKTGYQISAIKAMLDRLAEKFVPGGGSSDTFGTPQDFKVADSTSTSVALIWRSNSAAAGFNIYRSSSSTGTYAKINSGAVSGASFADRELAPSTTYYYQIRAIDGSGQESAPTSPLPGATAPQPPGCDPYFSDNVTHVGKGRALPDIFLSTRALGSNDLMGLYNTDTFSHLIKEGLSYYRVAYCP
jgi:poly(3-hydroxybutyrate) depolymerase